MSHYLLESAAKDDIDDISSFLEDMHENYSSTTAPMYPEEQLQTLYIREYAAENGHDEIGESAEELLLSNNDHVLKKRFVQAFGGIVGFTGGVHTYSDLEGVDTFLEENGAELLAEISSTSGEAVAAVSLALAGSYVLGESYHRLKDEGVPLDVDGSTMFHNDSLAEIREELLTEYDIDTYCKDPQVPKRYQDE